MSETVMVAGSEYEITYRQEVLSRFFGYVQGVDSFYLEGAASMGKTRLVDFLMCSDVQNYYLGDSAKDTWLVRVDLNRLPVVKEAWSFYFFELLLSSVILCCIGRDNVDQEMMEELVALDSDVIKSHDLLYALRFFEWGVSKLCQKHDIKLCFLIDEFDESYKTMPSEAFAQLRAVRDANKSCLLYALFLRKLPRKLRPQGDDESFYELLSRNVIGIGPYTRRDTMQVIQQLETNWGFTLTPERKDKTFLASGGHPGLIKAILSLIRDPQIGIKLENPGWLDWLGKQGTILEEGSKIWGGLEKDEQEGLVAYVQRNIANGQIDLQTWEILSIKGLLQKTETGSKIFSPLFEQYVKSRLAKL